MTRDPLGDYAAAQRAPAAVRAALQELERLCAGPALRGRQWTVMEVCGTHTAAIHQFGLKKLLPANLRLVSGPGCPVCVTPAPYLARALALARREQVLLTSFGDLLRVPVGGDSLLKAKEEGADVRFVVSPLDALALAREHPRREVVFLAVGFETTAPLTAATLAVARAQGLTNFSVLCAHRTMPQALRQLLRGGTRIDALLCPGHVAAVTGSAYFDFVARELAKPAAIGGFAPAEIMAALVGLVRQLAAGSCALENHYALAVKPEAAPQIAETMRATYATEDAEWRGLGLIPRSGLALASAYHEFDAARRFALGEIEAHDNPRCQCGRVLAGELEPAACPLFGKICTPQTPQGACMVSAEGNCAAAYKYDWVNA